MTDARYPQCRIVPLRILGPETAERLLNAVAGISGIRRLMISGPSLPATVPYGPARGKPNPNTNRRTITVGDTDVELRVQVGMVTAEVTDASVIAEIEQTCDDIFTKFPYQLQKGQFMKTQATLTDYAKYGPDADDTIIGLTDPRRKEAPIIIQGLR
ncbi:methyl-coenzyme M reductase operon protein D [Methanomicrobiaceae archaeon CYW5]|uniref:methyl-coenzyme M reductase operon protein D n=1 Tax=Methanovulcanius yangii TaxID=1789227 RepID=UPI0029C9B3CF|nr:methyl-coenzyme M reductase operon protein D [Methanovulcanius yangii]MBT8506940.1 methyl-coenzyme M reductase operon protein D [Methanovulcanius yangii]